MELNEIKGKDLSGFKIVEMTEVYKVDDDGRKSKSLGFLHDETIAKALAGVQTDSNWHETKKALVLTNGKVGFLMGEPVILLVDEKADLEARKKIMSKLSETERKLLHLE